MDAKNVNSLLDKLKSVLETEFPPTEYYIGGYADDAVCIQAKNNKWIVYTGFRGQMVDVKEYVNLFEACVMVISRLSRSNEERQELADRFYNLIMGNPTTE